MSSSIIWTIAGVLLVLRLPEYAPWRRPVATTVQLFLLPEEVSSSSRGPDIF